MVASKASYSLTSNRDILAAFGYTVNERQYHRVKLPDRMGPILPSEYDGVLETLCYLPTCQLLLPRHGRVLDSDIQAKCRLKGRTVGSGRLPDFVVLHLYVVLPLPSLGMDLVRPVKLPGWRLSRSRWDQARGEVGLRGTRHHGALELGPLSFLRSSTCHTVFLETRRLFLALCALRFGTFVTGAMIRRREKRKVERGVRVGHKARLFSSALNGGPDTLFLRERFAAAAKLSLPSEVFHSLTAPFHSLELTKHTDLPQSNCPLIAIDGHLWLE